jgi:hypothetical protein
MIWIGNCSYRLANLIGRSRNIIGTNQIKVPMKQRFEPIGFNPNYLFVLLSYKGLEKI